MEEKFAFILFAMLVAFSLAFYSAIQDQGFFYTQKTTNVSFSWSRYSISLSPGWNLFSTILYASSPSLTIFSTTCASENLWHYDSSTASYQNLGAMQSGVSIYPGEGYWFYASTTCEVIFQGDRYSALTGLHLRAGWNQIGSQAIPFYPFDSYLGSCVVTDGPFSFDTASNSYIQTSAIHPGKAYFVRVQSDCVLSASIPTVTPITSPTATPTPTVSPTPSPSPSPTANGSLGSCVDSDPIQNATIRGTVSGRTDAGASYNYSDTCVTNPVYLTQYYCDLSTRLNINSHLYRCSEICLNGTCAQATQVG